MKLILTILILLNTAFAQETSIGNQIKHRFPVTVWGHTKWGLLYLPSDFNTSQKKYPVIVYNHGLGETGSTENDLSKLLSNGLPNIIAMTGSMKFGEKEFICVSIQDQYWSPLPDITYFAIKNDPLIKDRIDTNGIFYTGLSAGGAETINAICGNYNITGIVPMSAAGAVTWKDLNKKVKVWAFHGLGDNVCTPETTKRLIDSVGGKWTKAPYGHGPWTPYYDKSYKENGMNIYEWMLSCMTPTVPVPIPPVTRIPLFVIYSDSSRIKL